MTHFLVKRSPYLLYACLSTVWKSTKDNGLPRISFHMARVNGADIKRFVFGGGGEVVWVEPRWCKRIAFFSHLIDKGFTHKASKKTKIIQMGFCVGQLGRVQILLVAGSYHLQRRREMDGMCCLARWVGTGCYWDRAFVMIQVERILYETFLVLHRKEGRTLPWHTAKIVSDFFSFKFDF